MFIIKGTPLEASFYGFYKDKHRKFCAIMTEIFPHLGLTEICGLLREFAAPLRKKNYFQFETCLWALEIHNLITFLWSFFYKSPVINVTLLTLKITVHTLQGSC